MRRFTKLLILPTFGTALIAGPAMALTAPGAPAPVAVPTAPALPALPTLPAPPATPAAEIPTASSPRELTVDLPTVSVPAVATPAVTTPEQSGHVTMAPIALPTSVSADLHGLVDRQIATPTSTPAVDQAVIVPSEQVESIPAGGQTVETTDVTLEVPARFGSGHSGLSATGPAGDESAYLGAGDGGYHVGIDAAEREADLTIGLH
jgi:hypothetical protein